MCSTAQEISTLVTENGGKHDPPGFSTEYDNIRVSHGPIQCTSPCTCGILNIVANLFQSRRTSIEPVECIDMTQDDVLLEGLVRTPVDVHTVSRIKSPHESEAPTSTSDSRGNLLGCTDSLIARLISY